MIKIFLIDEIIKVKQVNAGLDMKFDYDTFGMLVIPPRWGLGDCLLTIFPGADTPGY